jgi:thymidylate synthase
MIWYQRSVDTMIGLPSDIILAYMLNLLVANDTNCLPGEITMVLGDTHIYEPHYDKALAYVGMVRRLTDRLTVNPVHKPIDMGVSNFDPSKFELFGYSPMPKIDFELLA